MAYALTTWGRHSSNASSKAKDNYCEYWAFPLIATRLVMLIKNGVRKGLDRVGPLCPLWVRSGHEVNKIEQYHLSKE